MHSAKRRRCYWVRKQWYGDHYVVEGTVTLVLEASSKASSNVHLQAKASAFTEKVTECTEELHLDLMISEEEPNTDGTMVCYHNLLEIERVAGGTKRWGGIVP